jgi:hypothetical protein
VTITARTSKGKQHGIVDKIWRELKRRERAGELIAITIDEYLSSQVSIGIWNMKHHMAIVLMAYLF